MGRAHAGTTSRPAICCANTSVLASARTSSTGVASTVRSSPGRAGATATARIGTIAASARSSQSISASAIVSQLKNV